MDIYSNAEWVEKLREREVDKIYQQYLNVLDKNKNEACAECGKSGKFKYGLWYKRFCSDGCQGIYYLKRKHGTKQIL